ncbi:MAG: hypothetical protein FJ215_11110 [Ignavibacteria bacterium]|nr:hypothetical protein [Ignavibacteria bacterium]
MIAAIIFVLHIIAAIYAFVSRWKRTGLSEGLLAVAFITIIFSVGWTIATMIANVFFEPEGLAEWFNRDVISLSFVTLAEIVFYTLLLGRKGVSQHAPNDSTQQ